MTPINQHWLFEDLLEYSSKHMLMGAFCPKAKAFLSDFIESKRAADHSLLIIGGADQIDFAQKKVETERKPYQRLSLSDLVSSIEIEDIDLKTGGLEALHALQNHPFSIVKNSPFEILCQRLEARSHNLLIEVPNGLEDHQKLKISAMLKHLLTNAIMPKEIKELHSGKKDCVEFKMDSGQGLRVWIGRTVMPWAIEAVPSLGILMAQARSFDVKAVYDLGEIPQMSYERLRESLACVVANTNDFVISSEESLLMLRDMMRQFDWKDRMPIFEEPMFGFDAIGPMDVYLHSIYSGKWNLLSLNEKRQPVSSNEKD